jgi:putative phosphoribosyl transferase
MGLARGGAVVASEIAREFALPLDAVAVAKVHYPGRPERALGAAAPGGVLYLANPGLLLRDRQATEAAGAALAEVDQLDTMIHRRRPPISLNGRTCLLVDDGIATGASLIAAARWARRSGASRIVATAPLAARSAERLVRSEVDDLLCPHLLEKLISVSSWYEDFAAVELDDVLRLLDLALWPQPTIA